MMHQSSQKQGHNNKLPSTYTPMSNASRQFQHMKQAIRSQQLRQAQLQKVRTVNTIKWKLLMLETLERLALSPQFDQKLIEDLSSLVKKVPEEKFVEAIINLQPYKPNFKTCYILNTPTRPSVGKHHESSPGEDLQDETTTSGSILRKFSSEGICAAKRLKRKQELMAMFIEDDLLSDQISSPNHPYSRIIEGYAAILESKFKNIIDRQLQKKQVMSIQQITDLLSKDYNLIEHFFKLASTPIVDIFNTNDQKERLKFTEEVNNFIVNYLRNCEKICLSIRKILRYHIKISKELKDFIVNCPMQAEVQKFGLPHKFQIEGCYVYTTSQIISFSEMAKGKQCLAQLATIRDSIYKDIDEYYRGEQKYFEVGSQVQLEILKFALVKVQIFVPQVLAQLKLLEILFGSEEISYHFDEASYIHSQMTIAFEAIQQNL